MMPVPLQTPIDWTNLAEAVEHYAKLGYQYVEVPWIVPSEVTRATAPSFVTPVATPEGDLVGSGEQGLLRLALRGELAPGKYQTVTPCWRKDKPDQLHGRHFMKVEIMHLKADPTLIDRDALIRDAELFFLDRGLNVERVTMPDEAHQIDLNCSDTGIELGSYGIRRCSNVFWVYGTGCAEPRMSAVISRITESEDEQWRAWREKCKNNADGW